jgi:hypothetical protein
MKRTALNTQTLTCKVTLKPISNEVGGNELDTRGSRSQKLTRFCENDNEHLNSIKCAEFLD